ncbi:SGNH/GDSL hydrolase family protein [Streptomyces sp. NPDC086082]|uniref:SGNH/GDSL hydrolase family protein n=1 Tax=Streptomyces sp. NPDC086082 TaxID=3365750 RepID=UPI0038074CAF
MPASVTRRTAILGGALAAAGVALGRTSASAAVPGQSNGGVRIMPLGDSITDGYTPYPGGYRVKLWQLLAAGGYTVDFVGSQTNGPAELGDHDHEGHPGWRIDQLDANIATWLGQSDPRTIMLLIGTNDLNQNYDIANAPTRLSGLIDHIRAIKPQSIVFVATIPPQSNATLESRVRAYNAAIPSVVAQKGSRVRLVKMYDALTTADLADGIHPTKAGYEKMAPVWYNALRSVPSSLVPLRTTSALAAART